MIWFWDIWSRVTGSLNSALLLKQLQSAGQPSSRLVYIKRLSSSVLARSIHHTAVQTYFKGPKTSETVNSKKREREGEREWEWKRELKRVCSELVWNHSVWCCWSLTEAGKYIKISHIVMLMFILDDVLKLLKLSSQAQWVDFSLSCQYCINILICFKYITVTLIIKIIAFYFNIFKNRIYSCYSKAEFSAENMLQIQIIQRC